MPPKSKVNKEQLVELYVNQKKSGRKIAIIMGISKSTILAQIKKHNLSRTNLQETIRDKYGRFVKPDQKLLPPDQNGIKNPCWKNGIGSYQKIAFTHYGQFCKICGATKKIDIHHIDKDRTNNNIKNLLPICKSCHSKIHNQILNIKHMRKKIKY